jgi:hypothetical protein
MPFSSTRRRFVAAFAALGVTGLLPAVARAQEPSSSDGDTLNYTDDLVACSTSSMDGTFANPVNNYQVTALEANFAFVARIVSEGDNIRLFADDAHGGVQTESVALVKGTLTRTAQGEPLTAKSIGFETPLTALEKEGQYYGIVQMAHDQQAPIGLMFYQDDAEMGSWELKPGEFDPNSREVSFGGEGAGQIYGWLRSGAGFKAALIAGGQIYSAVTTETGTFAAFVDDTLVPAMDTMALQDAAGGCYENDDYYDSSGFEGCFLTTACCAVVGLPDDCWELATLRRFRDGWMRGFAQGRADIERYYREAPAVTQLLSASRTGRARLLRLYWSTIVPSALLIRLGANRLAWRLYRRMMLDLLPA